MKRLISVLFVLLPFAIMAETLHFPYNPALSPDGKDIYFSYDGDIFKVPAQGGLAMRLVSLGANETHPKVSPCGKWIAFASNVQGNNDVYVVPVEGGPVTRLTWHEASDIPSGWSGDSRYIYFESGRANTRTTYKVALAGGTPERLFPHYFNTVVNLVENPATGVLYFNESGESISFPTRKRYVGDHNPNIKSWNPSRKEYKELTQYRGKDTWPMVDVKGNLYYVSDEFNKESNIVKYNPKGEGKYLTKFDRSVQYPSISHSGNGMVFLLDYKIHYLNLSTGEISVPSISIADNNVEVERSFTNVAPTGYAISPDSKKLAMSIRGLLYVSDAKGKYLHKLNTPANERIDEMVWGKDNKTIYYTRTDKGFTALYSIGADGSFAEKLLYKAPCNVKNLNLSNKKDKLAFICGNDAVMLLNLADETVSLAANAQFWSYSRYSINFSPDDAFITFEAMNLFERDIYIYSIKDKKLHNLTNSANTEGSPVFSPCGKYLYMTADFHATSFPRGGNQRSVFRIPLLKYNTKPFKSDLYDELFKSKPSQEDAAKKDVKSKTDKKEEKKTEEVVTKIDFNNVFDRMERMKFETGSSLYVYKNKSKAWLLASGRGKVFSLEITDPDAEIKTIKELSYGTFISSDTELYSYQRGMLYKVDPAGARATKVTIKHSVVKNLKDEFEQMFYEAWGLMDQNFYDVEFHGVDWNAKRDYYASFLPHVRSRENLVTLFNDMLGELNSSHLGFRSTGSEAPSPQTRLSSMETGIIWNNKNPYMVERIVTGSPADNIDTDVKKGDILVAVNGERVVAGNNRESYLATPAKGAEVKFTFSRKGKEHDVKLHTISSGSLKNLLYEEWEMDNRALVDKLGKGKIAYTHMRDMGVGELSCFYQDMYTRTVGKEAIILDLRYNNGGNVHKEVLDFLAQKAHFNWAFRDNKSNPHPNVTPGNMPIIVLVNERSLSDAEVTSNGIKTLGLATIVGTETYRWIIFTTGANMLDGSTLRLPAWGCYSLDGKDLEATGVAPDIYVKNTFKDRLEGKDPQLERAIKEALKQLGNN